MAIRSGATTPATRYSNTTPFQLLSKDYERLCEQKPAVRENSFEALKALRDLAREPVTNRGNGQVKSVVNLTSQISHVLNTVKKRELQTIKRSLSHLKQELTKTPIRNMDTLVDLFRKSLDQAQVCRNFFEKSLILPSHITPEELLDSEVLSESIIMIEILKTICMQMLSKVRIDNRIILKQFTWVIYQLIDPLYKRLVQSLDEQNSKSYEEAYEEPIRKTIRKLEKIEEMIFSEGAEELARQGDSLYIDLEIIFPKRIQHAIDSFDQNLNEIECIDIDEGDQCLKYIFKKFYVCQGLYRDIACLIYSKPLEEFTLQQIRWAELAHHLKLLESYIRVCSALKWNASFVVIAGRDLDECIARLTQLNAELQNNLAPREIDVKETSLTIDQLFRLLNSKEPIRRLSNLCAMKLSKPKEIEEAHDEALTVFNSFVKEKGSLSSWKFFSCRKAWIQNRIFDWIDLNITVYRKTEKNAAKLQAQHYLGTLDKMVLEDKIKGGNCKHWEDFLSSHGTKRKRELDLAGMELPEF